MFCLCLWKEKSRRRKREVDVGFVIESRFEENNKQNVSSCVLCVVTGECPPYHVGLGPLRCCMPSRYSRAPSNPCAAANWVHCNASAKSCSSFAAHKTEAALRRRILCLGRLSVQLGCPLKVLLNTFACAIHASKVALRMWSVPPWRLVVHKLPAPLDSLFPLKKKGDTRLDSVAQLPRHAISH